MIRRFLHILMVALMFAALSPAQAQEANNISEWGGPVLKSTTINLWPDGLPNSNGIESQGYDDSKFNFCPSITVYLPESDKPTRAVVICPGGAYFALALSYEGHDWAKFFNNQGIATIMLKYRMPHGNDQVPQSDAMEAIRVVKEHAAEWNIDPDDVGIMGFSAGGHLASTVATHAPEAVRPAFQILIYPVVSMDPAITHMGSHDNLIGKDATAEMETLYSNEKQVTADTPHAFIALADDDDLVNPLNSINYYSALKQYGIPASLHVYPSGGHGFGLQDSFKYKIDFLSDLREWLRSF